MYSHDIVLLLLPNQMSRPGFHCSNRVQFNGSLRFLGWIALSHHNLEVRARAGESVGKRSRLVFNLFLPQEDLFNGHCHSKPFFLAEESVDSFRREDFIPHRPRLQIEIEHRASKYLPEYFYIFMLAAELGATATAVFSMWTSYRQAQVSRFV